MASLYDLLGFVSPLLLLPKRLLQDLCRKKCCWDDPVDEGTEASWNCWQNDNRQLGSIEISRCIKPFDFDPHHSSLHFFSDASEIRYGAVAYALLVASSGSIRCNFLFGKSRVCPLKPISIPRLELQAAVLSVKLMHHIRRELKMNVANTYVWTDSTVLHCIFNTNSRFKTFMANRIGFIARILKLGNGDMYRRTLTRPRRHPGVSEENLAKFFRLGFLDPPFY